MTKFYIADALSRAPLMAPDQHNRHFEGDVQAYVDVIFQDLPITERRLEKIRRKQDNDPLCQEVARYCQEGWPEKGRIKGLVNGCYPVSSEISIVDGLFMRNEWLIIPSVLQKQVLEQLHTGHQGIGMCCERARQTVWWPG